MQSNSTPVLQEEIAGPAPAFAPIQRQQRFASMDVLRGIALLGILIANVSDFSLPGWDYLVPLSTSKPVFTGPHAAAPVSDSFVSRRACFLAFLAYWLPLAKWH